MVVNCFHLFIFDISETVSLLYTKPLFLLWIAFIYLSLTYQKQLTAVVLNHVSGCELLSFIYLWHIRNSSRSHLAFSWIVVNCFHLFIFDISETVVKQNKSEKIRCELLSFIYLWHIRNSFSLSFCLLIYVVNCFHLFIFDISETVRF